MKFNLKEWQALHGFTYEKAAEEIGIGRTTFYEYLKKPEIPKWLLRACRDIDAEKKGLHQPISGYKLFLEDGVRKMNAAEEQKKTSSAIRVALNGTTYKVTWDEECVLDTIEREKDGKLMTIKNPDARRIYNNADALFAGRLPDGFEYAPKVRG